MADSRIKRTLAKRGTWENYSSYLPVEYRQSIDEGKPVQNWKPVIDGLSDIPLSEEKEEIADIVFQSFSDVAVSEDFPYDEPDEIEKIREAVESAPCTLKKPDEDAMADKVRGAWVGRTCGCLLGKPIEGRTKEVIHGLLRATGNSPMRRYIRKSELSEEICADCNFPYRSRNDYIDVVHDFFPMDDDTNYTVMAAHLLERYGRDFTPDDVKTLWMDLQPKRAYCTAERVAYLNFMQGFAPPASAVYKNPFREWIGAQIRGDYFGYINPCDPRTAADMAWRDAVLSHVKNGIYGEMFAAAMLAVAASAEPLSPEDIIRYGVRYAVPSKSRMYAAIEEVLADYRAGMSYEAAMEKLYGRYDDHDSYDWCHVIPNACIVCIALLYGQGDYSDSICKAVQIGFDTDCNGATVGSILGMRNGFAAIDPVWYTGVEQGVCTTIFGYERFSFDEAVRLTCKHIRR